MVKSTINKKGTLTETVLGEKEVSKNPRSPVDQITRRDRLSKFKDLEELEENADFIKDIEEALKLHDQGKVKRMNADAFLKEIKKW